MAKASNYANLVDNLLRQTGGKDNITFFTHCMTRLRFNLKDKSVVDLEEIKKNKEVLGAQWSNEQLQVVIGSSVKNVYDLICEKAERRKKKG